MAKPAPNRARVVEETKHPLGATVAEIAARLPGLPKGTISSSLTKAESLGLIYRDGSRRDGCAVYRFGSPRMVAPPAAPAPSPDGVEALLAYSRAYRDGYRDGQADARAR